MINSKNHPEGSNGFAESPSQDKILSALRTLTEDGQTVELRAFFEKENGGGYTLGGYFNDLPTMAEEAARLSQRENASGVYFTPNPVRPALLARANNKVVKYGRGDAVSDEDATRRRWLLLDFDAERPSGISATDAEKEKAQAKAHEVAEHLRGRGWPDPVGADSGNGVHLMYRIDEPAEDRGLIRTLTRGLSEKFSSEAVEVDDKVHNPARIWKLYGTVARKGDALNERPHRRARLVQVPDELHAVGTAQLQRCAQDLDPKENRRGRATPTGRDGGGEASSFDGEKPSEEEIAQALSFIPEQPDYGVWIRVIAGVLDGCGGDTAAAGRLLRTWSSENQDGEYERKLSCALDDVGYGTVVHYAKQHGFEPSGRSSQAARAHTSGESKREGDGGGFTLEDFREALGGRKGREAERKAADLIEQVATLRSADISRAVEIFDDADARAHRLRDWRKTVAEEKERMEEEAAAAAANAPKQPCELRGGELIAWVAEKVEQSGEAFARDTGGALYYYEDGCYHPGGRDRVRKRCKQIMRKYELKRWSRHRRDELEAWFRDDAPRLKERPPSGRLCLENGILDLETFELEEHGPEKWLSTVKIPIRYDPEAEGTAWQEHFASVLPEELHRAGVGTELFARLLTPATGKRKAILFKGPRDTGKSQTLRNLMRAIGASGGVTRYKLQELEQKAFSRARLFGKVANVNADLPARPLESTSVFKKITGGDAISAEHKHKTGFEFTPHCHLLFSSNHPLRVKSAADEEAFWDRWLVLPFTQQISEEEQESAEQIEERLQDPEELSAFLNRALALLPQVEENGIEETPEMELELRRMRRAGTADNESNAPTGDGHRSGDGHATAAPAPPQPTGSKKPANKKEKESKSDRPPPCQNEDNFISSETPAETPQTGKGDETPRRGDGSSSNTSTPAVSGDGHGPPPHEEEVEVLYTISGDTITEACGFGSGGPNEPPPEESEGAPGEDSDGGNAETGDSSGQPPPPGA